MSEPSKADQLRQEALAIDNILNAVKRAESMTKQQWEFVRDQFYDAAFRGSNRLHEAANKMGMKR